jgi:hypothetical protein
MWKRMAASVGVGAVALSFGILIVVLGTPVRSDSAFSQKFSVVGDKTQGFVDELLSRMIAHRRWQDSVLREYQAHRLFYATNQRFNIDSTLEVDTTFRSPGAMQSTIVRQDGSAFIREHVFLKILAAESDLSSGTQADVIPENYQFTLVGADACGGRPCWRLALKPRRNEKFLLDGDVWLDAEDYGVSRIHGFPAKRVSIWISKAEVDWHFRRINGIWLTDKVESSSDVRLFGNVRMQIHYDYNNVGVGAVAKNGL